MYANLAIIAVFAFIFSAFAGRVERSMVTGPIIFILFGLVMGPYGFNFLRLSVDDVELRILADLTLALVLYIDAANANLKVLRGHFRIPGRMLLIGMPGSIALGVLFARWLFPGIGIWELCVLATMLAATDAALGKGVVTNKAVPARLREGLNAESGLNDGLAVPILLVFLALASGGGGHGGEDVSALGLIVRELGIGAAVGIGLTLVGVAIATICSRLGWTSPIWSKVFVIGLALACFATAQSLHGSGYIAAFVGGLLFGHLAGKDTHELVHAAEGMAELLAMATWIIFGSLVIGYISDHITWQIFVYSLLSLTVIRVVPMFLSLTGVGESTENKLFLSWFGPRGLASIVFVVIVAGYHLPHFETLATTVGCTVALCVIAHGVTAFPWARRMGRNNRGEGEPESGSH